MAVAAGSPTMEGGSKPRLAQQLSTPVDGPRAAEHVHVSQRRARTYTQRVAPAFAQLNLSDHLRIRLVGRAHIAATNLLEAVGEIGVVDQLHARPVRGTHLAVGPSRLGGVGELERKSLVAV